MSTLARTDTSVLTRWWWTVDRWNLAAVGILAMAGAVLALAASPPVAARLGLDTYHFAARQAVYLGFGLLVVVATSLDAAREAVARAVELCQAAAVVEAQEHQPQITARTASWPRSLAWLSIGASAARKS